MEAMRRCQTASRRLGFRMRHCAASNLRKELRAAQIAVDDTRLAIQSATHLAMEWQQRSAAFLAAGMVSSYFITDALQKKDADSQTDHLLRSQVHALACSRGTANPKLDLDVPFELHLLVEGQEFDNVTGVFSGALSDNGPKITINGEPACYGERLWGTWQLSASDTVECTLSTDDVLNMANLILDARNTKALYKPKDSFAKNWDDNLSDTSTEVASSLGCTLYMEESSSFENDHGDHFSRTRASQEVLSQRRRARVRRRTRGDNACLPAVLEDSSVLRSGASVDHLGSAVVGELGNHTSSGLHSEDSDTMLHSLQGAALKVYNFKHTEQHFVALHRSLQGTSLKVYNFKHSEQYFAALHSSLQSAALRIYNFKHTEQHLWAREKYEALLKKSVKHGDFELAKKELDDYLVKKSHGTGCDRDRAEALLRYRRSLG
eukprot:TRINITY_DN3328_c0_g1_i10.p1 TRINITY_DN3328_c0_g1~~TRINITY_DN3328_c0_g1_i10.p1  ORF type:complete len:435 (+),score=78.37 TRINITY_DN3328_c0_g1_i10:132-1436(+)